MCSHIFFCKQRTAYELRISDWSSDVCSSDLAGGDSRYAIGYGRAAAVGDARKGPRHVDQPYIGCAKHHGRMGVDRRGDSEPAGHVGPAAIAHILAELGCYVVQR